MHKQKLAPRVERRAQVRYPHRSEASCRMFGTPADAWRAASFQDLSCSGASLMTAYEVRPGAVVEVMLEGTSGRFSRPLLMRVRNVRAGDDATWQAGCSFVSPLTDHDVELLLLETTTHTGK
jgi:hypothetical protein